MTSIDTRCTHCQAKLNIEESMIGTTVRCPACEFTFEATPLVADTNRYDQPETTVQEASPGHPIGVENSSLGEAKQEANDDSNEGPWFLRLPEGQQFGPISREELDTWVE